MNLQTLKTELTTDPLARGYAAMGDQEAAVSLNTNDREPERDDITAGVLMSALVLAEYNALTAVERRYFDLLVSAGSVTLNSTVRQQIRALFPQGTQTKQNLNGALKRVGSRADELGIGNVTPSDIADAKRL